MKCCYYPLLNAHCRFGLYRCTTRKVSSLHAWEYLFRLRAMPWVVQNHQILGGGGGGMMWFYPSTAHVIVQLIGWLVTFIKEVKQTFGLNVLLQSRRIRSSKQIRILPAEIPGNRRHGRAPQLLKTLPGVGQNLMHLQRVARHSTTAQQEKNDPLRLDLSREFFTKTSNKSFFASSASAIRANAAIVGVSIFGGCCCGSAL